MKTPEALASSVRTKVMEAVAELDKQINELTTMRRNLLASLNPPRSTTQVTGRAKRSVLDKAREILLSHNDGMKGPELAQALNVELKKLHALVGQEAKRPNPRIRKIGNSRTNRLFVA
jgi:hypothetical protein